MALPSPPTALSAPDVGTGMPTVSDTYIENRQRVQPTHTNNYESAHGGNVVKWMDEIGAMSAMRAAGETCVTAKIINGLDFKRPVPQGDTCIVESYVYAVGRTSLRTRIARVPRVPSDRRARVDDRVVLRVRLRRRRRDPPDAGAGADGGGDRCRELRDAALAAEPDEER